MESYQFFCFVFRIRSLPPQIATCYASASENCFGLSLKNLRLFLANRFPSFLQFDRIFDNRSASLPLSYLPASISTIRSAIEDHSYWLFCPSLSLISVTANVSFLFRQDSYFSIIPCSTSFLTSCPLGFLFCS